MKQLSPERDGNSNDEEMMLFPNELQQNTSLSHGQASASYTPAPLIVTLSGKPTIFRSSDEVDLCDEEMKEEEQMIPSSQVKIEVDPSETKNKISIFGEEVEAPML